MRCLSPVFPQCHVLLRGHSFDNKFLLKCNMLLSGSTLFQLATCEIDVLPNCCIGTVLTLLAHF